jgi:hypothetical protein
LVQLIKKLLMKLNQLLNENFKNIYTPIFSHKLF